MLTRQQAFDKLGTQADFIKSLFGKNAGGVTTAPLPTTVEQWLNLLRVSVLNSLKEYGPYADYADHLTNIGAMCVLCVASQDLGDSWDTINSRVNGIPTRRTIDGYVLMVDHYLRAAIDGWVTTAGDGVALNNLRKVAAVCVRCLEEHGR
jgi:hypothetical protein